MIQKFSSSFGNSKINRQKCHLHYIFEISATINQHNFVDPMNPVCAGFTESRIPDPGLLHSGAGAHLLGSPNKDFYVCILLFILIGIISNNSCLLHPVKEKEMDFAFLSVETNLRFHLLWAKALKIHDRRGYNYSLEEEKLHQYWMLSASFVTLMHLLDALHLDALHPGDALGVRTSHAELVGQRAAVRICGWPSPAGCSGRTLSNRGSKLNFWPMKCVVVWRRVCKKPPRFVKE